MNKNDALRVRKLCAVAEKLVGEGYIPGPDLPSETLAKMKRIGSELAQLLMRNQDND